MKKILTICLLLVFCASPLWAGGLTGTLKQINDTGKIRIGFRKAQPPISFLNEKHQPDGYSVDLGRKIAADIATRLGKKIEIEYIPVTAANRFQSLVDNRIDLLCGATTKTLTRSEIVDFTQLTFVTGAGFISLRGEDLINNFDGKKIGVVKKTTTIEHLRKMLKKTGAKAEIIPLNNTDEAMDDLVHGKIDAFTADQVVLIGLILDAKKPGQFVLLPSLYSFEPFALALRRNDSDFRLAADRVLSRLYRSNEIMEIYKKWFGQINGGDAPTLFRAMIKLNSTPE